MPKIKVAGPLVELDGDEMARVVWARIKDTLLHPYLDLATDYHDLSIQHRDATADRVTHEAARALIAAGVGAKCATITHDPERQREFGSPALLGSPNVTLRHAVNGTVFREPILCGRIPRLVPHWEHPIVIARHAFGDQHGAAQIRVPGAGTLVLRFIPADGGAPIERIVATLPGSGVALGMYNLDASIADFARSVFRYGLERGYPVYLSTKNTILQTYDGRFVDGFQQIYDAEFADRYRQAGLRYAHRLIDDMAASSLKSNGGFIWACKNYDGDVQSDVVAQGYGSLGLMTSVLAAPDGGVYLAEAAHGTVTRHYRAHCAGEPTSTNPVASIFAWTRALRRRGQLDGTPDVTAFAEALEQACLDTLDAGGATRDLAVLMGPDQPWLTTEQMLGRIGEALRHRLETAQACTA